MRHGLLILTVGVILFSVRIFGQAGGNYAITQSVVASGGGQSANGGSTIEATTGQSLAGNALSGSPFALTSGFWNFTQLAPTAANASISGRILTAEDSGVMNVIITLTRISGGQTLIARSSAFGYYRFENVPVGETYILTVQSKRFIFYPSTRIVTVFDELTEVDFTAQREN